MVTYFFWAIDIRNIIQKNKINLDYQTIHFESPRYLN